MTLPVLKGLNFDEKDAFIIETTPPKRLNLLLDQGFVGLSDGYAGGSVGLFIYGYTKPVGSQNRYHLSG